MEEDNYSVDYYSKLNRDEVKQAQALADIVVELFNPRLVIDFGCATGLYLKPFIDKGIQVQGYELSSNALDPSVCITPDSIRVVDLRIPIDFGRSYDVAICLEVLEHIKKQYSTQAVANICRSSNTLVVSTARPGQPGEHHHTLEPREWWLEEFRKYGFKVDSKATEKIIEALRETEHTNWIDNIFVCSK